MNVGYYPPASGTPHSNKTISSGQHFILKPTKTGNWTVNFTSTESKRWSCWVIYDPLAPIKLPLPQKSINVQTGEEKNINIYKTQDMIYVLPSDDFKSFSNLNLRNSFISMNDLVNETYDLKNSHFIRMFKNYSIGDVIYFKDRIGNIEYCEEVNATKFTFNILDDTIDWYFKGDLTNIYNTGEDLSLKFKVVTEYADNNFEFETLDYLKNSINGYEDISQYLLKNNF